MIVSIIIMVIFITVTEINPQLRTKNGGGDCILPYPPEHYRIVQLCCGGRWRPIRAFSKALSRQHGVCGHVELCLGS